MYYKAEVYNDMGHLNVEGDLPEKVRSFVYSQASKYVDENYRKSGDITIRTYSLKRGLQRSWKYSFNNDTVDITWSL